MATERIPSLLDDRSNRAAYYNVLADELEELSNVARLQVPHACAMAKRLKAFAEEIRADIARAERIVAGYAR